MSKLKKIFAITITVMFIASIGAVTSIGTNAQVKAAGTDISDCDFVVDDNWAGETGIVTIGGENWMIGENAFATIQNAVDNASAGDTINVAAGTYGTPKVTHDSGYTETLPLEIDKSITLISIDGPGSTIIDANKKFSPDIDGRAMSGVDISADDVTLDGFNITNVKIGMSLKGVSSCLVTNNRFDGLYNEYGGTSGILVSGFNNTISSNVFKGDNITTGIHLGATGSNEVYGNDFSETDWYMGSFSPEPSATVISVGPATDNPSDNNGVYNNTITSSDFETGIKVGWSTQNEIYNNTVKNGKKGIKVSQDNHTEIHRNIVENNTKGIWLYQSENNSIHNNTVSNNGKGIYLQPEQAGSYGEYYYIPCKNNLIEYNDITGNDIGVYADSNENETEGNNTINYNNMVDNTNYGVKNDGIGTLVATNNWWGDPSGPNGVGPGEGDAVSGNVDYSPWFLEEDQTSLVSTETESDIPVDDGQSVSLGNTTIGFNSSDSGWLQVGTPSSLPGEGVDGKVPVKSVSITSNMTKNTSWIRINYSDTEVESIIENSLQIYRWNGTTWNQMNRAEINTEENYVNAIVPDTSTFTVAGAPEVIGGSALKSNPLTVWLPYIGIIGLISLFGGIAAYSGKEWFENN